MYVITLPISTIKHLQSPKHTTGQMWTQTR